MYAGNSTPEPQTSPTYDTMKKRAKALCTDWTAYRALHVNRQIIPTGCSTQSTLLAKPKKDTNLSRGKRLKDIKEWKFSVEGGGG